MTLCNMATKLWAESSKYTTIVSKCAYQRCRYNVLIYNHGKWQDRWPMKIVMGLLTLIKLRVITEVNYKYSKS